MLHYWVVEAAPALAGNLGLEFWNRVVIQQCQHNYVVRNAVLALGSFHQDRRSKTAQGQQRKNNDEINQETLVKYNRAIRSLRLFLSNVESDGHQEPASSQSLGPTVTSLICCALFYCYEGGRGNSQAAMQHLKNGIAILNRSWYGELAEHEDLRNELIHLFARLDLQASMYDDTRAPLLNVGSQRGDQSTNHGDRTWQVFSKVEEAHEALTAIQNRVLRFLGVHMKQRFVPLEQISQNILAQKSELLQRLATWHRKLTALLLADASGLRDIEPGSSSAGLATLLLHAHVTGFILYSNFPNNPLAFGGGTSASCEARTRQVHECLDLAEAFLNSKNVPKGQHFMSAEMGGIAPVFLLVMKTSDYGIASRGLSILKAVADRREGLHGGDMTQKVAAKLMALGVHQDQLQQWSLNPYDLEMVPAEFRGPHMHDRFDGGLDKWPELISRSIGE